jgi:hypothetical protein
MSQRELMFGFAPPERATEGTAAGVSLKVFDVGSGPGAGFLERLHWAMAIFAAHDLVPFCEHFVEGARKPTPTHLHLALRDFKRLLLSTH